MTGYQGQTPPSTPLDPRIPAFFETFYAVSDSPTAHEAYVQSFTPDAAFIMGSKQVAGSKDILALRQGLWTGPVKTRRHRLAKIFPFGSDSREVMVYGTVDYGLTNGRDVTVDWAGRAVMAEYEGALRMAFYQVYLDSAAVANAAKD